MQSIQSKKPINTNKYTLCWLHLGKVIDWQTKYNSQRPGVKTGVQDWMFWSDIGSGFGQLGGKPQRRIP